MNESKKNWRMAWGWLVVLAILQPAIALSNGNIRIHLTQQVRVDSAQVTLSQIADILGPDPEKTESMAAITIARSPLPGQSLWLHPGQVQTSLNRNGWDAEQYEITANGPVKVTRNYATVPPEKVTSAVVEFIKRHAPWESEQMKIRPIRYQQSHQLPPGKVSLSVTAPKHTDWLGAIPFKVRIKVDGQTVKRTSVPAYIEVWQDVVLSAKPIGKNQPIFARDIRVKKMNLARVPSKAVFDPDQVIGKKSSRSVSANTILRSDHVHEPLMVRKGDVVQVLAESKVLRVTAQAVAKQNGVLGDNIQVMNLSSRKKFFAQVIDSQTVRVEF